MITECAECDRPAIGFFGGVPYCKAHRYDVERALEPEAQSCPKCGAQQPASVVWERTKPCSACQARDSGGHGGPHRKDDDR